MTEWVPCWAPGWSAEKQREQQGGGEESLLSRLFCDGAMLSVLLRSQVNKQN